MKKRQMIFGIAAMMGMAALFTSCGAIEKATERDLEVGDFDFTVNTTPVVDSRAEGSTTRAEGATHFSGSATVTRYGLLSGASFDFDMVKSATVGAVSVEVVQELAGVTIENLTLTCDGAPSVTMTDVPLTGIDTAQQAALQTFAAGVIMRAFAAGEATVSVDATFSGEVSEATVGYLVELSEIVIRAGIDL
jgi:hypothetical protein